MNIHIVFQGLPDDAYPLINWVKKINVEYFLTHIVIDDSPAIDNADEIIRPKKFWNDGGVALVHHWEQPARPDSYRKFKQMTYSMNMCSLSRLTRDLNFKSTVDAVLYYNSCISRIPDFLNNYIPEPLNESEIIAESTDAEGWVSPFFFITRPHNFDRISLLWKKNNVAGSQVDPDSKTWWHWLRILSLSVKRP
jgi:hypothetical protein